MSRFLGKKDFTENGCRPMDVALRIRGLKGGTVEFRVGIGHVLPAILWFGILRAL